MIDFVLPNEAFEVTVTDQQTGEGAVFQMRRLKPDEEKALLTEHTERGRTDARAWTNARLQAAVTGWSEGAIAVNGASKPFDRDLIPLFPDWLRGELLAGLERARPTPPSKKASGPSSTGT